MFLIRIFAFKWNLGRWHQHFQVGRWYQVSIISVEVSWIISLNVKKQRLWLEAVKKKDILEDDLKIWRLEDDVKFVLRSFEVILTTNIKKQCFWI